MNHYYYIAFESPLGVGSFFYRGKLHPLHPEPFKEERERQAREMSLMTRKIIQPESIVYITIQEIPFEVAKVRWPEDSAKFIPLPPLDPDIVREKFIPTPKGFAL